MRVIITGGTGLIGRALSTDLAADDHELIVLSRSPASAPSMPGNVRVVRWDARAAEGWDGLADGADVIVNLAGASLRRLWTKSYKRVIQRSRINAGEAVVEAVVRAERKPRVVIQASGAGYYGARGDEPITEEAGPGSGFLGKTADAWEASTAPVEEYGVRRAIIRSGVVLSARGGAFPLLMLPFRFFLGGSLGSGDQWLPWIHIEDEVRAIRFLMESEKAHGPFNLTAPGLVTNRAFNQTLGKVMHRPALFRIPSFALRLVLGEMSSVVLHGQRVVPKKLLDLGFSFHFPELEGALRDLIQ